MTTLAVVCGRLGGHPMVIGLGHPMVVGRRAVACSTALVSRSCASAIKRRNLGREQAQRLKILPSFARYLSSTSPLPQDVATSQVVPPASIVQAEPLEEEPDYLQLILSSRVYDVAIETPLERASSLSAHTNNDVLLKREDLQPVFSFKIRGAYNKISHLTQDQLARGIVCCSAGNHAQGVALAAKALGVQAKIVMPLATPSIKVRSVQSHGGPYVQTILHGLNYDEAAAEAKRLCREENLTMILPFDDPLVIAGQGTCGAEIIRSRVGKSLDYVFVCCGGGGLLAGIAAYIKRLRPSVKVIGVEAEDAAGMTTSLLQKQLVTLDTVGLFADGAAVRTVGTETFRLCSENVDEMITVTTDEICWAIKDGFNDTRTVLEPAGALAIAGLKKYAAKRSLSGKTLVATCSGANVDFDRLRFIADRADDSETLLAVTVPDKPGSFQTLYSQIFPRNVTEFSYRYSGRPCPTKGTKEAQICLAFQAAGEDDKIDVIRAIGQEFKVMELTNNELAKSHIRNLNGGRSTVEDELLLRFVFPERPQALNLFLQHLNAGWNVSLFHYRNKGDDFARVLVGIQVPVKERSEFQKFLDDLGYDYHDETENPVYKQFLI